LAAKSGYSNNQKGDEDSKKMFVADIDVHLHELPGEMAEFCEMPWRKSLLEASKIKERYLDIPGLGAGQGSYDPLFPGQPARKVSSPDRMRKDLDQLGIDAAILFPDHLLSLAVFPQKEYPMALARAYNRLVAKKWLGKIKGFYGAICIAPQDPQGSAEEIREMSKNKDFACVYLPAAAVDPLYGDSRYDPIYEVAEKLGLPLVLHGVAVVHPAFPCNLEQFPNEFGRHSLSHPLSMIANLVHMMSSGTTAKFPNLKICFAEGAISWVPWAMMRLDKEYIERRREVPFLKERPSQYIGQFGFGTQPIEEPVKGSDYSKLIELIGNDECILFASDWPHHDFDHPKKILSYPLAQETKERIMGKNALKFFPRLNS
jgi:uncharacterized protein